MIRSILVVFACLALGAADSFRSLKVPSEGGQIHCLVGGKGDPILLLTGGPGLSGAYLRPVGEALVKTHRVFLPDQRGTGLSTLRNPEDPEAFHMAKYLEDLERIRTRAGVKQWAVLGSSWGGTLAAHYAAKFPDRVKSLVFVDSGPLLLDMPFVKQFQANLKARLGAEEQGAISFWDGRAKLGLDVRRASTEAFRVRAAAYCSNRQSALALAAAIAPDELNPLPSETLIPEMLDPNTDPTRSLQHYKGAVLILHGSASPIPKSAVDGLKAAFPQARIEHLEACGHWPWWDQPDHFFQVLGSFLAAPAPN